MTAEREVLDRFLAWLDRHDYDIALRLDTQHVPVLARDSLVERFLDDVGDGKEGDTNPRRPMCSTLDPEGFICTRPPGHSGDHAAWGGYLDLCARWPQ